MNNYTLLTTTSLGYYDYPKSGGLIWKPVSIFRCNDCGQAVVEDGFQIVVNDQTRNYRIVHDAVCLGKSDND